MSDLLSHEITINSLNCTQDNWGDILNYLDNPEDWVSLLLTNLFYYKTFVDTFYNMMNVILH